MVEKYRGGVLTNGDASGDQAVADASADIEEKAKQTLEEFRSGMSNWKINDAIKAVWTFIRALNKYIDVTAPWILAKDESKAGALDAVLYHLCEGLRFVSLMAEPVIPIASEKIWNQLGLKDFKDADYKDLVWAELLTAPWFTKATRSSREIEIEEDEEEKAEPVKKPRTTRRRKSIFFKKRAEEKTEEIDISEFFKTDLRVAEIMTAEKVEKSNKLIKMTVSLGGDDTRTVVSGISQYYKPEDLVGKHVIFVSNLKPAKLMGIESQGMILGSFQGRRAAGAICRHACWKQSQMTGLFDTHAHLYDKAFDKDREDVIARIFKTLDYVVIPSEDLETSQKAVRLADTHEGIYAAVGIHPQVTNGASDEVLAEIAHLAKTHDKIKAIGEIGLDYHYLYTDKDTQKYWFERQIQMAKELDLPILIHDREAHGDVLEILKRNADSRLRGILHCFSGSIETAKELMKLGFYISFAGPVVFSKSIKLKEVAADIPMDRLLIETDSPYLTPPPYRGKRNDPSNVLLVAEELARIKNMDVQELIDITRENAMKIYQIHQ